MTIRDRTPEFASIVKYLQETNNYAYGRGTQNFPTQREPESTESGKVNVAASQIQKLLLEIKPQLIQLRRLARTNSLFNDPGKDFNRITNTVKMTLKQRENDITNLVEFIDTLDYTTHQNSTYTAIISNLNISLAAMSKEFASILQIRSKSVKQQNARRRNFEVDNDSGGIRKRRNDANSRIVQDSHNPDFIPSNYHNQQQQQQRQPDYNYHEAKAKGAEMLATTIHEIGGMMNNMARMVGEQESIVLEIDQQLDESITHLDGGNQYLMKYYNRVSSSQMLIIKIFAVIIFISVFLIVYMK